MNEKKMQNRESPLEISSDEFRKLGYQLVDLIAGFLDELPEKRVAPGEGGFAIREALGQRSLPASGTPPAELLEQVAQLMFDHSTHNGHPHFWGYITSSAAPLGALGDLLASSVNCNLGGWAISPMASEIESQSLRWIAEMIGYHVDCGGILVSGGNMANFVCFLAARTAGTSWDLRAKGFHDENAKRLRIYASTETHTWIQKAADMFGLGTDSIRWMGVDEDGKVLVDEIEKQIRADRKSGDLPFLVIGTAGSVSTGVIDPLPELAELCKREDVWFHVDGAYGGFAAVLPEGPPEFKAFERADSIAVDPHKWLYVPLEAGCSLVRDPKHLLNAFSYRPPYYHLVEEGINFFEYGPQNSRGFRALKVWLAIQQAGREGYIRMISDDIKLAREMYQCMEEHPEMQAFTCNLSIATFRYVPEDLRPNADQHKEYLNELNLEVQARLNASGTAFVSNAVIDDTYLLRACIVNFRTSSADVQALPEMIASIGRETDLQLRGR